MTCAEFLRHYSDYRDGLVRDGLLHGDLKAHLKACRRCGRLIAIMDSGLAAVRGTQNVAPSSGFRAELDRRLGAERAMQDAVMPAHAGLAATFLVAAAVGLLLYEGLSHPDPADTAPTLATSPFRAPSPPDRPLFIDVTLPAFTHSDFTFTSSQTPLGSFAALAR
jgi:hypothetical protein